VQLQSSPKLAPISILNGGLLLGQERDPLAQIKHAVNASCDVVVPIGVENFGFWLKAFVS